jgi:hypothetical protein
MKAIPLPRIISAVSGHTGIEPAVVCEGRRHPKIMQFRQLVAICAKRLTLASFEEIAEAVTGTKKQQSTYSIAFRRGMADPAIVAQADAIEQKLRTETVLKEIARDVQHDQEGAGRCRARSFAP